MRIYLHIGYPKTGSSAIQLHLFTNRPWFLNQGFYIPTSGFSSESGHAFLGGSEGLSRHMSTSEKQEVFSASKLSLLAEELAEAERDGYRNALISWEGFALASDKLKIEMHRELSGHQIVLLAYVREQGSMYRSVILQRLEILRNISADKIFEPGKVDTLTLENYLYDKAFTNWKQVFADSLEIRLRIFDKNRLEDGNIIKDFLSWLELLVDPEFALQTKPINHSIDGNAAALIMIAKSLGVQNDNLYSLIGALSHAASMRGSRGADFLSDEDKRYIRSYCEEDNKRLFQHYRPENASVNEHNFPLEDVGSAAQNPSLSFDELSNVYSSLRNPPLPAWGGAILKAHQLRKIVGGANGGWRGCEDTGVWSVGRESELAFLIPEVHPVIGPSALRLVIEGHYFDNNHSTCIRIQGKDTTYDLTRQEILVEIDDHVRENGVKMILKHENPGFPSNAPSGDPDKGLAFKLALLYYDFIW